VTVSREERILSLQSSEGILSSGPTFMTYKYLEKAGFRFHFCKLRTREHDPCKNGNAYKEPRIPGMLEGLLKMGLSNFKILMQFSPLILVLLRSRFRNLRDLLWAALPVLLYAGARELGPSPRETRQAWTDAEKALDGVNKLLPQLTDPNAPDSRLGVLGRRLRDNPQDTAVLLAKIKALLAGKEPVDENAPPVDLKDWGRSEEDERKLQALLKELNGKLKTTPEGVVVPKTGKDKGNIYVHSKVIIVDGVFAMVGSANHNERSMWHDSEDMLAFAASERHSVPADLRKQLINTVLSGDMPENDEAKKILCISRDISHGTVKIIC
jgi:hypothetical protein